MSKTLREIIEGKKKWPEYYVKKETKRSQDEISKQVKKSGKDDLKRKKKAGLFPYNEETEQLDELKLKTLQSYHNKAKESEEKQASNIEMDDWVKNPVDVMNKRIDRMRSRQTGLKRAENRLLKGKRRDSKSHRMVNYVGEETEQLDELTGRTLAGYNKASAKDMRRLVGAVGAGFNSLGWANKKAKQREKGIGQATDRMRGMYNPKRNRLQPKAYHAEETEMNETDTISLTVPLFIRMLEFAKEDAKTDMDLHKATENILDMQDDDVLDMDSYEDIVDINEGQLDEWIPTPKSGSWTLHAQSGSTEKEPRKTPEELKRGRHARQLANMISSSGHTKLDDNTYNKMLKKLDRLKEETEIDEGVKIKRKVGRADIKTAGDLAREKRERSNAAKDAIKRMKETGKKIRFQSFGRWDSKRKSAREKLKD